ncbi:MAG: hypothetical protein H6Q73_3922 [Firmicutes bacterium]|nr:hypothetical protein [Bacillota bacterium]
MKKIFPKTALISMLILGLSTSAFAMDIQAPQIQGNPPPPPGMQGEQPNHDGGLKALLGSLVIDNIISRDQAVKVLEYFGKSTPSLKGMPPTNSQKAQDKNGAPQDAALNLLVNDGVITKTQADAIDKAIKTMMPPPGGPGGPGNSGISSSSVIIPPGMYNQSGGKKVKSNQAITTAKKDQSGVKVTAGGTLSLSNSTITTTGDSSSMDNSSFYGLNAGVLAESGSKIDLKNCTINTTGTGANGVFACGTGSSVTLSKVKINCTADAAHGVDATLKGILTLNDVDITTAGAHGAAISTDRGEGTITVNGGTFATSGVGSPGIYSTGDIKISGAKIAATGSEAAVIEGKNSIALTDTTLSGAKLWGVMLYQSFSGDADIGTSKFTMNGGSLTAAVGPVFYATNTKATIDLSGASIQGTSGTLLTASSGAWGKTGANGANVTFNADNETLAGNIICDNISSVTMALKNGTTLKGSINANKTMGSVALTLDKTSTWCITGNSYLTSLTDADSTLANIDDNGYTIYYDAKASANSWLGKKTYTLTDGGKLTPRK